VHDRRRRPGARSQRSALEPAARAGGAREPGAAPQSARQRVRVGLGGRSCAAADAVGRSGAEARRMIEINLLPGKKKKEAGAGAGFRLALPDFQGLLASIKNPWLLTASAASVLLIVGGLVWLRQQRTGVRGVGEAVDAGR